MEKQISTTLKLTGISQFNNFQYNEDGSITVWRSFDFGERKKVSKTALRKMGLPQEDTGVMVKHPFSKPRNVSGVLKSETGDKNNDRFTFPEQGCVKNYLTYRSLQNHLDYAMHALKLHEKSQYDEIIRKWGGEMHFYKIEKSLQLVNGNV